MITQKNRKKFNSLKNFQRLKLFGNAVVFYLFIFFFGGQFFVIFVFFRWVGLFLLIFWELFWGNYVFWFVFLHADALNCDHIGYNDMAKWWEENKKSLIPSREYLFGSGRHPTKLLLCYEYQPHSDMIVIFRDNYLSDPTILHGSNTECLFFCPGFHLQSICNKYKEEEKEMELKDKPLAMDLQYVTTNMISNEEFILHVNWEDRYHNVKFS